MKAKEKAKQLLKNQKNQQPSGELMMVSALSTLIRQQNSHSACCANRNSAKNDHKADATVAVSTKACSTSATAFTAEASDSSAASFAAAAGSAEAGSTSATAVAAAAGSTQACRAEACSTQASSASAATAGDAEACRAEARSTQAGRVESSCSEWWAMKPVVLAPYCSAQSHDLGFCHCAGARGSHLWTVWL